MGGWASCWEEWRGSFQATGTCGGEGSGVDEQFARRRTLWLSAVGATLPLHRRGRDKLGVEDATVRRKGK